VERERLTKHDRVNSIDVGDAERNGEDEKEDVAGDDCSEGK
jgi:hypothetical protein